MKNLQSELLEHRVNAVEGKSRPADPSQKGGHLQHDFANSAVRIDTPEADAVKKHETKN